MVAPTVKFKFNPESDADIAWLFYNQREHGGVDFWEKGAVRYHEVLANLSGKTRKKQFLSNYVASLYGEHYSEFKVREIEIAGLYKKNEDIFFAEVKKMFKEHSWPRGKYIAYLSIFDFGPRFLKDKTFQVFMYDSDSGILFTIFHEMLHFMFYDYCLKKYPAIFRDRDPERGPFWEIAELFNAVAQQGSVFKKIHGPIGKIGYPALESIFSSAQKAWTGDVDEWVTKFAIPYLEESPQ
jgi:hypothetical protein